MGKQETQVREQTIPTEQTLLVCKVSANLLQMEGATVSVRDPYGRILDFLYNICHRKPILEH
jgi:hypothetical protein